jgi:hypothetical protein
MTCKKENSNPIYTKSYSFSRCFNQCGKKFNDCSCDKKCKKSGDCCSDYKFCEIIEKNKLIIDEKENNYLNKIKNCKFSTVDNKTCLQCNDNFYLFENTCVEKCPKFSKVFEENKFCLINYCMILL